MMVLMLVLMLVLIMIRRPFRNASGGRLRIRKQIYPDSLLGSPASNFWLSKFNFN